MNFKNIVTTAAIVGSTLGCKQTDHPLTAQDYDRLDSLHKREDSIRHSKLQASSQQQILNILKQKDTVSPAPLVETTNNDTIIPKNRITLSPVTDTVWSVEKQPMNTPNPSPVLQNNHHEQDDMKLITVKEKIVSSNEIESLPSHLEKEWKEVINIIITPSKSIKFDEFFIKSKVFEIFSKHFVIKNNQVFFISPTTEQAQEIYHSIDEIRSHIKSQNGARVKLLLSKWKMRSYISEKLWITYKWLILNNQLSYKGGSQQFETDIRKIIDIYQ